MKFEAASEEVVSAVSLDRALLLRRWLCNLAKSLSIPSPSPPMQLDRGVGSILRSTPTLLSDPPSLFYVLSSLIPHPAPTDIGRSKKRRGGLISLPALTWRGGGGERATDSLPL